MQRIVRAIRQAACPAAVVVGVLTAVAAAAPAGAADAPEAPPSLTPQQIVRVLGGGLLLSVFALVVLAAALIALLRFSRRFRQRFRTGRRQIDTSDVWVQHRLPPDWDENSGESTGDHADLDEDP